MDRHPARLRACGALRSGLAILLLTSATQAAEPSPEPPNVAACSAYDLDVLTTIEDHGLVGDTPPEALAGAALALLAARKACRNGEVDRAIRLYEAIALDHIRMLPFHRILLR